MVRGVWILTWLALGLAAVGCDKTPSYGQTVTVDEGGAVWEVRLNKAFNGPQAVFAQLDYANKAGPAFSLKPQNVVVTDDEGNRWIADGRFMLIPMLAPGNTQTLQVSFSGVKVGRGPLYLHPFSDLAHAAPKILLKAAGDTPLPGDHTDPRWDSAK